MTQSKTSDLGTAELAAKRKLSSADSDAIVDEMNAVLNDLEALELDNSADDASTASGAPAKSDADSDEALLAELVIGMDDDDDDEPAGEPAEPVEDGDSAVHDADAELESASLENDAVAPVEVGDEALLAELSDDDEALEAEVATAKETVDLGPEVAKLREQVLEQSRKHQELEQERANVQDRLARTIAEFANYRRRMEREAAEAVQFANEKLFRDTLPVIDSLSIALEHAGGKKDDDFGLGVRMVYDMLLQVMGRFGVVPFDSNGELFDPMRHEAVARLERDDLEPNTVIEVMQRGFFLHERLLRPAKVVVSCVSKPPSEESEPVEDESVKDDTNLEEAVVEDDSLPAEESSEAAEIEESPDPSDVADPEADDPDDSGLPSDAEPTDSSDESGDDDEDIGIETDPVTAADDKEGA